jgi:di/tricarboxylate transporter
MLHFDPSTIATLVALGVLAAIATNRVPQDAAMVAGMVALLLAGVLTPEQALAGFGNTGLATIAVLYLLVAGLRETGAMAWATQRLVGNPTSVTDALLRLAAPTGVLSAFVNNTPVVAIFIPVVQGWASRFRLPASKLLMPLSFIAILTGTCTLIGTSTNLVVDGLLRRDGGAGLGMFAITPIGLAVAGAGLLYLFLAADRLLPDRASAVEQLANARQYAFELRVVAGGPLVGRTIGQAGLRHMAQAYVLEIEREGRLVTAVGADEVLRANDRLVCVGVVDAITELRRVAGLEIAEDQAFKLDLTHAQRRLVELVVSPSAPFVGSSVRDSRFRSNYDAAILSVSRDGARLAGKVGDMVLRAGDTLLVEADAGFANRHRFNRDFLLVSALRDSSPPDFARAPLALAILAAVVLASSVGWLGLLEAGLLGAGVMVATRCLTLDAARDSIEWPVLIVIGASFAVGMGLERSGAAASFAALLMSYGGADPFRALLVVYLATVLFTELITNNAAAALMFPLGVATATALGVSPLPFAVAIMFAASASFLTPIGYQTNLMVYGPGGYRFGDYLKFGLPLTLIVGAVTLALVPRFFPFNP